MSPIEGLRACLVSLSIRSPGVGSAAPLIASVVHNNDILLNLLDMIGLESKDAFISLDYSGDVVINLVLCHSQLCEVVRKIHNIAEMLLDIVTHRQRFFRPPGVAGGRQYGSAWI